MVWIFTPNLAPNWEVCYVAPIKPVLTVSTKRVFMNLTAHAIPPLNTLVKHASRSVLEWNNIQMMWVPISWRLTFPASPNTPVNAKMVSSTGMNLTLLQHSTIRTKVHSNKTYSSERVLKFAVMELQGASALTTLSYALGLTLGTQYWKNWRNSGVLSTVKCPEGGTREFISLSLPLCNCFFSTASLQLLYFLSLF